MLKFIILLLFTSTIYSSESINLDTKVISVYDGDTFTIEKKDITNKNYKVRIRDIDTPELGWRGKCIEENIASKNAKEYLEQNILNKQIKLINLGTDKYGRLLADVYLNNINIGQELVNKHYAVIYKITDKKPIWCNILKRK